MTTATKLSDKPHARIYAEWLRLPSWRNLSAHARALLVEMLASYRPGMNGALAWSQREVSRTLHCGNLKADAVMAELEKAGWIEVTRAGAFAGARTTTTYRLTLHPCAVTGDPPSKAFLTARPPRPGRANKNRTDAKKNPARFQIGETPVPVSIGAGANSQPMRMSDALRNSLKRKGLLA